MVTEDSKNKRFVKQKEVHTCTINLRGVFTEEDDIEKMLGTSFLYEMLKGLI